MSAAERWVYPETGFYSNSPHKARVFETTTRLRRRKVWRYRIERKFVTWSVIGVSRRWFSTREEAVVAANAALDKVAVRPRGDVVEEDR